MNIYQISVIIVSLINLYLLIKYDPIGYVLGHDERNNIFEDK